MWPRFTKQITNFLLVLFFAVACFITTYNDAHAIGFSGARDVSWDSSDKKCKPSKELDFNPFMGNPDIDWEIDNPICITFVATAYALLQTGSCVAGALCANYPACVSKTALLAVGVPLSPLDPQETSTNSAICNTYTSNCANPVTAAAFCSLATACCNAHLVNTVAKGIVVSNLAIIYAVAKDAYDYAQICANDWQVWAKVNSDGEEDSGGDWMRGAYTGSHKKYVQDIFKNNPDEPKVVTSKNYREYLYGGEEYEDNGNNSCSNPSTWDSAKRTQILGYTSDKQRYYMNGPATASVYACQRFLTVDRDDVGAQKAYECCKKRSQYSVCIRSKNAIADWEYKFCEVGSRCNVAGVWYDVVASQKNPSYACVQTYSVCPYNHLMGGGTETTEYRTDDISKVKNYCQVFSHCSKIPVLPYIYTSDLDGAFIDSSCRDMKGDAQNVFGYSSSLLPINNRGFSAPMAQCFKETLENLFLNQSGHSECEDPDEFPDENEVCASGNYKFQKGVSMTTKSFFQTIQDNLQTAIKMALTVSVMALGFNVLMGGGQLDKKQLMGYIMKLGLVMYFAAGDGWQNGFVTGILGSSELLSDIMFQIEDSSDETKLDGCQFPRFNYADSNEDTRYNNPAYPTGKEYLRIWDTLDCKIARALGFGPEVSVPNLGMMILGGFLTGGAGIIFMVGTLMFAFFFIAITIKALHVFLMSTMAIIILLYVSPITIVLAMFGRTKSIFDGWWKAIMSYALQPMILFAYMSILISIFDMVAIGDLTFEGDGHNAPKTAVCTGDAEDTSLYCIFNVADMKNLPGFEVIGIGLPVLTSMNQTKIYSIIKAAFLLYIFMSFLDKISALTTALVGGTNLDTQGAMGMMKKMAGTTSGALSGIQQRGMNAIKKHGKTALRKGGEMASKAKEEINKESSARMGGKKAKGPKDSPDDKVGDSNEESSTDSAVEISNEPTTTPPVEPVKDPVEPTTPKADPVVEEEKKEGPTSSNDPATTEAPTDKSEEKAEAPTDKPEEKAEEKAEGKKDDAPAAEEGKKEDAPAAEEGKKEDAPAAEEGKKEDAPAAEEQQNVAEEQQNVAEEQQNVAEEQKDEPAADATTTNEPDAPEDAAPSETTDAAPSEPSDPPAEPAENPAAENKSGHSYQDHTESSKAKITQKSDKAPDALKKGGGTKKPEVAKTGTPKSREAANPVDKQAAAAADGKARRAAAAAKSGGSGKAVYGSRNTNTKANVQNNQVTTTNKGKKGKK